MSDIRFLLDEHVWGGLVDIGKKLGLDIVLVQTRLPAGSLDEDVLTFAAQEKRVLLTSNAQDFAPLAVEWFLAGRDHAGIIIVPGQTNKSLLSTAIGRIVERETAVSLHNSYHFLQEFL